MRMDIDEAGRECQTARVDFAFAAGKSFFQRDDLPSRDRDASALRLGAAAVNDIGVLDYQIVAHRILLISARSRTSPGKSLFHSRLTLMHRVVERQRTSIHRRPSLRSRKDRRGSGRLGPPRTYALTGFGGPRMFVACLT